MQRLLADKSVRVFQVPEGVVFAKIDSETGLLPVPTEHTPRPSMVTEPEQFFKDDL